MSTMLPRDIQLANEYRFSKKFIDKYLEKELLSNDDVVNRIDKSVELIRQWLNKEHYESKTKRLNQLKSLNLHKLVLDVLVKTMYCQTPELFTSVSSQIASKLGFNNKLEGIKTAAELLVVICETDCYDIKRQRKQDSWYVVSNITPSALVLEYVRNCSYLPPMICRPNKITSNSISGYLTHNSSVILRDNFHNDEIALDVINTQNNVSLSLSQAFLEEIDENPTYELDSLEKTRQWADFKRESNYIYKLMLDQGNEFFITNRYDKRGRMYASGYHINPQGTSYKKAMLEFTKKEVVTGVN